MKKMLLMLVAVLALASSSYARETLDVVFVFDKRTLILNEDQRNSQADKYLRKLNKTFSNSGLYYTMQFRKKAVGYAYISKRGENLWGIRQRYFDNQSNSKYINGKPIPSQTLQYYQRYYKADIVIGIMNDNNSKASGVSVMIPLKNDTVKKKNTDVLAYGDYGICFLNYKNRNQKEQLAHEIGHGFGLWHGKRVGSTSSNAIETYANGFGSTDYAMNYGTVMAGRYITPVEKGIDNSFSNPHSHKCGYYADDEICGDSTAYAVKLFRKNAKLYNKRGDWYK